MGLLCSGIWGTLETSMMCNKDMRTVLRITESVIDIVLLDGRSFGNCGNILAYSITRCFDIKGEDLNTAG